MLSPQLYKDICATRARGQLTDNQFVRLDQICRISQVFPRRGPQRSPDRQRSLEVRRTLGSSSVLPPALRKHFTAGEQSVIYAVLEEARAKGYCESCNGRISTRSQQSLATVHRAVRKARQLGVFTVHERRRRGRRSHTNIIRVASQDVRMWRGVVPTRQRVSVDVKETRMARGSPGGWVSKMTPLREQILRKIERVFL